MTHAPTCLAMDKTPFTSPKVVNWDVQKYTDTAALVQCLAVWHRNKSTVECGQKPSVITPVRYPSYSFSQAPLTWGLKTVLDFMVVAGDSYILVSYIRK